MAITGTLIKGVRNNTATVTTQAVKDETFLPYNGDNGREAVLIRNAGSSAATVTFTHGDGVQGVENGDLSIEVTAGEIALVCLESGVFNITTGENKGAISVSSTATVQVATIEIA